MNSDIRISIGFLDHPKTIKLKKELGWEGIESLMRLWFFVAQYKPDGVLSHMDAEEVEIASKWNGRPGLFVSTAQKLRLLDHEDGTFSLHDWDEHNSYCVHAMDRKEQARKAAEKGGKCASKMLRAMLTAMLRAMPLLLLLFLLLFLLLKSLKKI